MPLHVSGLTVGSPAGLLAWGVLSSLLGATVQEASVVTVDPRVLRGFASTAPLPTYPAKSLSRGSVGVAVAELDVNFNGTIADVRVLQAPDPEIASSLATVLRTWRFRVVQQGVDRKLRSRLVFYYRLENSHPVVLDAAYLLRGTLRHVANGQDPIRTLPK